MAQELYELPDGWEWQKLNDVLVFKTGFAFKASQYVDKGLLVFRVTNITKDGGIDVSNARYVPNSYAEEYKKYELKEGDILIVMVGATTGKMGIVTSEAIPSLLNQNQWKLDVNHKIINSRYCYFCFRSFMPYFLDSMQGAAREFIKQKDFKELKIPIPPLNEQKRIVAKIDALFTRIDTASTHLQQTLELSKALFASALDEVFQQSSSTRVVLTDVVNFIGGSQPPKAQFSDTEHDGYVRLIQIRDYKSDAHKVYVKKESTKKFCAADDVMIGRYGPPVFQILRGLEGAYNVALMKAAPDEGRLSKMYLFWFLRSPAIQHYIVGLSQRAAGQSGVNKKALEKYEIPLPNLDEQQGIVSHLEGLSKRIGTLESSTQEKLHDLTALKASLLDAAFKGQL